MGSPGFPTGMRDVVIQLRAQGFTLRDITAQLPDHFPGARIPTFSTLWEWVSDPESAPLVEQERSKIRAGYVAGAREVMPRMFERIAEALDSNETQKVRDLSQAMAAVTRGIVADRVEVSPDRKLDALEELSQIALRHGLSVSPTQHSEPEPK